MMHGRGAGIKKCRVENGGLAETSFAGARILVAEDEFIIAGELELYLRDLGCVVLGPTNSIAATLALLEGARPDAAVLDVRLPDGFVTPVAELLASAGVPFLLVTGCMDLDLDVPALRDALCLDKPFSAEEVRRALVGLLLAASGGSEPSR